MNTEDEEHGDAYYNELNYDFCPVCHGVTEYMGMLGNLIWLRCIDCGTESHVRKEVIDNVQSD